MNISRQTFGRIIEAAHKKIADVLANAKALKIEGGKVTFSEAAPGSRGERPRDQEKSSDIKRRNL